MGGPRKIGECAYFHDEVRTDERAFACGSVLVHKECMLEYIVDTYDVDELAKALLFESAQDEG